jgi:hypothetical protein
MAPVGNTIEIMSKARETRGRIKKIDSGLRRRYRLHISEENVP